MSDETQTPETTPTPPATPPEPDPLWVKIVAANERAFDLKSQHLALAEEAKDAKKAWEAAVSEVQYLIRETQREYPLFDAAKVDGQPAESRPEPQAAEPRPEPIADWQSIDVEYLTRYMAKAGVDKDGNPKQPKPLVTPKIVEALRESSIHTLGDISKLHENRLTFTDIKGIGEAAANKLDEALAQFWAENPQPPASDAIADPEPEAETPDEGDPTDGE